MKPNTPRMPSSERRAGIVDAALREFAESGYVGTSADSIARRVGVTQPYVLRVFGSKKALFLAVVRESFARTRDLFEREGARARLADPRPLAVLHALGASYVRNLGDRDLLRLQLQAYAACGDPEIRSVVAEELRAVYTTVATTSGADREALDGFFANGALINVMAVVNPPDDPSAFDRWAAGITRERARPATESEGT